MIKIDGKMIKDPYGSSTLQDKSNDIISFQIDGTISNGDVFVYNTENKSFKNFPSSNGIVTFYKEYENYTTLMADKPLTTIVGINKEDNTIYIYIKDDNENGHWQEIINKALSYKGTFDPEEGLPTAPDIQQGDFWIASRTYGLWEKGDWALWNGTDFTRLNMAVFTTDEVEEGTNNLYYTDERVKFKVDGLTAEGGLYDENNVLIDTLSGAINYLNEIQGKIKAFSGGTIGYLGELIDTNQFEINEDGDLHIKSKVFLNYIENENENIVVTYSGGVKDSNIKLSDVLNNIATLSGSLGDLQEEVSSLTTDDIEEGTTNLYYTDDRVKNKVNNMTSEGELKDNEGNVITNLKDAISYLENIKGKVKIVSGTLPYYLDNSQFEEAMEKIKVKAGVFLDYINNVNSRNIVVTNENGVIDSGINLSGTLTNISNLSGAISTLESNISTLSNSIATLSGTVSTLSGDVSTLSGSVSTLSLAVTTLSGAMTSLDNRIDLISGSYVNKNFTTLTTKENLSFNDTFVINDNNANNLLKKTNLGQIKKIELLNDEVSLSANTNTVIFNISNSDYMNISSVYLTFDGDAQINFTLKDVSNNIIMTEEIDVTAGNKFYIYSDLMNGFGVKLEAISNTDVNCSYYIYYSILKVA